MKRKNLLIFICLLSVVLVGLLMIAVRIGNSGAHLQTPPTGETVKPSGTLPALLPSQPTFSQPIQTTTSVTELTAPPIDYDAMIAVMLSQTQDAPESLFRWIKDHFGEDTILALNEQFADGYELGDWYTATGNTLAVLKDLHSGAAYSDPNIHYQSAGTPGCENQTTTLLFGGDICLADNYLPMQHMTASGHTIDTCIDPVLIREMQSADISFLVNEFTISDRGEPMDGKMYTFRAATANTALYQTLGIDLVSLANNHAYDYGKEAFLDTLDTLRAYEIAQIGGGRNLSEAMQAQYYIVNGRKIAFVGATRAEKNIMTPAATEYSPGVLRCYDTALTVEAIQTAKAESDFVVLCIHWGTEYSYSLETAQTESAREYIDAGADLIMGSHAHQLQGIEFYNGKPIFYNMGNFWFNSYEIETGLVKAQIADDGAVQYTFLPALQMNHHTTAQMGTDRGQTILETLRKHSDHVKIDENGVVTEAE